MRAADTFACTRRAMRIARTALTVLVAFGGASSGASAQGSLALSLDTASLQWGERATLCATWTTAIDRLNPKQPWWPQWADTTAGGLEILADLPPDTAAAPLDADGDVVMQKCWVVTSWDSGFVVVPPVAWDGLMSNAVMIDVATPMLSEDARPAPPTDIVAFEWTWWERLRTWLPWALLLAALGGLAWWAKRWWQQRLRENPETTPCETPPLPPHEIALTTLRRILAEEGWNRGKAKDVHVEAGLAVRHYVEGRFGLHAAEKTTREFRDMLPASGVPREWHARLVEAMEAADGVKFAKVQLPAATHKSIVQAFLEFVEHTQPQNEG